MVGGRKRSRSDVNELLLLGRVLRRRRRLRPRRLALVELGDDLGVDAVELLLGKDAQQAPGEVERVEDAPRLVRTWPRAQGPSTLIRERHPAQGFIK